MKRDWEPSTKMTLTLGEDEKNIPAVFKNPIDILAWSWGLSCGVGPRRGDFDDQVQAAGEFKVHSQNLSMTKYLDPSTPSLVKLIAEQYEFKSAKLVCENENGRLIYRMKNCRITSLSSGGSGGEERLTENFTMSLGTLEVTYTEKSEGQDLKSENATVEF